MPNKRICISDLSSCPCKIVDIEKKKIYCNFNNIFVNLQLSNNENNSRPLKSFLRKICPELRNKILQHDHRAKQLQKQEKEFLENVKQGDVCFCTSETDNVIFLKHPSNIYGDVMYRTVDGKVYESPPFCFRIISKGNKFATYESKNKKKIENYERLARMNGFRVEIHKKNEKILLKIFGECQGEIDNFVTNLYFIYRKIYNREIFSGK
ncbi:MAG: hypothetical protein ACFFDH_18420 [Promethearchaeota archaeon]